MPGWEIPDDLMKESVRVRKGGPQLGIMLTNPAPEAATFSHERGSL